MSIETNEIKKALPNDITPNKYLFEIWVYPDKIQIKPIGMYSHLENSDKSIKL